MVVVANHLLRTKLGGAFVLRIDDTDPSRLQAGAEERLREDLAWLGITVDEGPDEGQFAPYRQSLRSDLHCAAAEQLVAAGRAVREVDGTIVLPSATADVTVPDLSRGPIRIAAEDLGATVLVRPGAHPSYHLASAVDDHGLGITHVLRGEDHLVNTARHLMILAALDVEPPVYAHLPIVVGEDGAKLSGRNGALGLRRLRDDGWAPAAVVDWLARSACPAVTALPASTDVELAAAFDPARLGHGTTRLDPTLLTVLGRDQLARGGAHGLAAGVIQRLEQQGEQVDRRAVETLAPGLGEAANLAQAVALVLGVLRPPLPTEADARLRAAAEALLAAWSTLVDVIEPDEAGRLLDGLGVGKRAVRGVLTGSDHGVPLPFVLAALQPAAVVARARAILELP